MVVAHLSARSLCFIIAVTSGVSLLLKVYGVLEMSWSVPFVVMPCCAALLAFWVLGRRGQFSEIAYAIGIGVVGGLLSTLAYDAVRLPFHLFGYLVFATNSTYGMWVSDAAASTRMTEVLGWLYHFSNGITFAIMYAVFMRGRHWIYAVIYAFVLESIAIFSQFGEVFALAGNYSMISIAYLAHVAYAIPIGLMVQHWDRSKAWMNRRKKAIPAGFALFFLLFLIPIFTPAKIARDADVKPGVFQAEGSKMSPFIQKIAKGGSVSIVNNNDQPIIVQVTKTGEATEIAAETTGNIDFPNGAIHQIYIETERQTTSSFVIVEPVSDGL